jgi:cytochrome c biogenesis protein CcmG, thiol:disulfide interchange protein DsbE
MRKARQTDDPPHGRQSRRAHDPPTDSRRGERMTRSRIAALSSCVALILLIVWGLSELPKGSPTGSARERPLPAARVEALLAGSPAPLAAVHAQAGEVLGGGASALRRRLAALKGYPVVINKWASWCTPCKAEFGAFQRVGAEYGRKVAFLGIDSNESVKSSAVVFLRSHPVSYPSYYDKSGQLGEELTDSSFTPVTVFIPRHGNPYVHQGQYPNTAKLQEDVRRYALGA